MALELLNLFDLFVNNIFGGIALAFFGLSFIITAISFLLKLSPTFLIFWLTLWTFCYWMLFFGGLVSVLLFVASLLWMGIAIWKSFIPPI